MKQAMFNLVVEFLRTLGTDIANVRIQAHTWTKDKRGNTVIDTKASVNLRNIKPSIEELASVMSVDSAGIEVSTCNPALKEQCRELVSKVIDMKRLTEEFHASELQGYTGRVNGQQVQFTGYKIGSKPVDTNAVLDVLKGL